jgi:hypothetical protein
MRGRGEGEQASLEWRSPVGASVIRSWAECCIAALCAGQYEIGLLVCGVMTLLDVHGLHWARMPVRRTCVSNFYRSGSKVSIAICTLGSKGKRIGICTPAAVVYPDLTDNSRAGKSGTIVSFHHGERRRRYGTEPVIVPTPPGRSRVDVPHGACLVA